MCYQTILSWLSLQQFGIMSVLILLCHQGMVAIKIEEMVLSDENI